MGESTPGEPRIRSETNETPAVWPASRGRLHRDRSGVFPTMVGRSEPWRLKKLCANAELSR